MALGSVTHLTLVIYSALYFDIINCTCPKQQESMIQRSSMSDTILTDFSLWSRADGGSTAACASDCARDRNCVSFFYNSKTGVCTAHAVQLYSTQSTLVQEGSLYYTLLVDKWDCDDILRRDPTSPDGLYIINPADEMGLLQVYCDMTAGDGWTVFQRRIDGTLDFNRDWASFKNGFGDPAGELWLGNEAIHRLTSARAMKLRIEMIDQEDEFGYAEYSTFSVDDETNAYRLTVAGFTGDRGDSLEYHDGMMFSTTDRDYDTWTSVNCAENAQSAWWFKACKDSNLNGVYGSQEHATSISWYKWHGPEYSMKWVQMKMKPV